jgi:1-phosphofructokinase family hexose kinase
VAVVILTVTSNPALDLTVAVERLDPGATHRVPPAVVRAGGKGVNVARILHAAGIPVLAAGPAGGDTGAAFAAELTDAGVPHELVAVEGATRRSYAIVDAAAGEATVLNERGAPISAGDAERLEGRVGRLAAGADLVVISGSVPPGWDTAITSRLIASIRARGIPVIADLGGASLLAACRAGADVVKPNREELREATGLDDPLRGAAVLRQLGAGVVVVSSGSEGMRATSAAGSWRARLDDALSGNATGAGDAAVAAIADRMLHDPAHAVAADLPATLRRAVAWSASAVLMPAAGELHPSWPELERRVRVEADPEEIR